MNGRGSEDMATCCEFGKPQRLFVSNPDQMRDYILKYNHRTSCYRTVYDYTQSFNSGRPRPNYDTAIVDKVFFDFDGDDAFDEVRRVHRNLKDVKHAINFSGRGFHVFVFTQRENIVNKREALRRYTATVSDKVDKPVIGDLARLVRIPYTYHLQAQRYCIPLCGDDLDDDLLNIKGKSVVPTFAGGEIFGEELISLKEFDYPEDDSLDEDLIYDIDFDAIEGIPKCVQDAKEAKNPGYDQRKLYFTFMRESGVDWETAVNNVRGIWSNRKLKHALYEEYQPQNIWKNNVRFPGRTKVLQQGLCKRCGLCI